MPVVRGQFHEFLRPGARKVFIDEYDQMPRIYTSVLPVDTTNRAFEDELVSTGLPIAVGKPEGVPIAFDRPVFRAKVRWTVAGYGLGYEISREAVADDQYAALSAQGSRNLAWSLKEAEEITGHSIFINAFNSALLTSYDGAALCSDTHTGVGGLTFDNLGAAADLSTSALKAAFESFWDLKTDRGLRITGLSPDTLFLHDAGYWAALEILRTRVVKGASSGGEISSIVSDEAFAVVTTMGLNPIRSPYLVDTNAYYLMAPMGQRVASFVWRETPMDVSGTDERAGLAWFGIMARWGTRAIDWRWMWGSQGT